MTGKLTAAQSHIGPVWSYEAEPGFYDEVLGSGQGTAPALGSRCRNRSPRWAIRVSRGAGAKASA